jgi:hypothetical protein
MTTFKPKYNRTVIWQAIKTACLLSFMTYIAFKVMFYEFLADWKAEIIFFVKFYVLTALIIFSFSMGVVILYKSTLKLKRVIRSSGKP